MAPFDTMRLIAEIGTALRHVPDRDRLRSAASALARVRAWCDAAEAEVFRSLATLTAAPECDLASAMRTSLGVAGRTADRAATIGSLPSFESALAAGDVHGAHIDEVTRIVRTLDPKDRAAMLDRVDGLVDVAEAATPAEWGRRLSDEARRIRSTDGLDRLARQRGACRARTRVDHVSGMWELRATFDPLTGVSLSRRIERAIETLRQGPPIEHQPADPIERNDFLRAHAVRALLDGGSIVDGRDDVARSEIIVVIDTAVEGTTSGVDRVVAPRTPRVDWGLSVDVPDAVIADLAHDADVSLVVLDGGIVVYAPGVLDLGRSTRLASRAQRRAMRARYRRCAVPGCEIGFDRCKMHHIVWWRHGGRTDLANLVPVCAHHHAAIHDRGWQVQVDGRGHVEFTTPDGSPIRPPPPAPR